MKVLISLVLVVALAVNGYGFTILNGSGTGYGEDGTESVGTKKVVDIYIERGAGYFLSSYSDYLDFSNRFEMQDQEGIDFSEWNKKIDSALANIKLAKKNYELLIWEAENTPYNWNIIYRLMFFDYYGFMKLKRLNRDVFSDVEYYLGVGDINGVFKRIYNELDKTEEMLLKVKLNVDVKQQPNLELVWDLNDSYTYSLTFGQYVTRVFYAL